MVIFVEKPQRNCGFFAVCCAFRRFFCKFAPNKNEIGRRGCMICSSLAVAIQ